MDTHSKPGKFMRKIFRQISYENWKGNRCYRIIKIITFKLRRHTIFISHRHWGKSEQ